MDVIKVVLVNNLWDSPLFIALLSSVLTGFLFAIILQLHKRCMDKKDVLASLTSELAWNYKSLKKIQDLSEVENLKNYSGLIAAYRNSVPLNKDLRDKEIVLDIFKNTQCNFLYTWLSEIAF